MQILGISVKMFNPLFFWKFISSIESNNKKKMSAVRRGIFTHRENIDNVFSSLSLWHTLDSEHASINYWRAKNRGEEKKKGAWKKYLESFPQSERERERERERPVAISCYVHCSSVQFQEKCLVYPIGISIDGKRISRLTSNNFGFTFPKFSCRISRRRM